MFSSYECMLHTGTQKDVYGKDEIRLFGAGV